MTTMYQVIQQQIPQNRRAEVNEKILSCINNGKDLVPKETIYNCYTGIGGLHNLKQEDFANYNDFSSAKKEIELGQFFTPHDVCKQMVELISPEPTDMILDMCCGMGNFFNHLPNQFNAYGFDVDINAVKVAQYLYPDANIEVMDIKRYNPDKRFDIVIGNPPFNLDFDGVQSQFYYINKAYWVLNPAGLLMLIVPLSFLQNEFWEKMKVTAINRDFSFIGQMKLPSNAFSSVGVQNFNTKIMVFMRESKHLEMKPYNAEEFVSPKEIKKRILDAKQIKQELRIKIIRETQGISGKEEKAFEYKLKKYLYELNTHKHLQKHYKKAVALVSKFRNQTPPANCTDGEYKEWLNKKLTYPKILSILYRYIKNQNYVPRKEVALVRTKYGFRLKGYAPHLLDEIERKYVPIHELVHFESDLPQWSKTMTPRLKEQYRMARKTIECKRREYLWQSQDFSKMERNPEIDKYINSLIFTNREMKVCQFTELQKQDMGLVFQKRYSLLNWQQGSGKTAVVYHFGKYLMDNNLVKNVIVLAPAIATNLTWEDFLTRNGEPFITLKTWKDIENIPQGIHVVVSLSMITKLKKHLYRFMKKRSQKVCLILDESDEITNPSSQRTETSLNSFRRARYKILATGTTTRNNIGELYSQFELLYNNSVNMMCNCPEIHCEDKEKNIRCENNANYGKPFPAKGGAKLFKACFCPGKTTVFGIEKQNQDVYNQDELRKLIGKTIITRKFREFAGEKYQIQTHSVTPGVGEKEVYRIILEKFCTICNLYFQTMGDSKKEAALRIIRQIQLLIKACSIPNMMLGYKGSFYPHKTRYIETLIKNISGKIAIGCTTLDALDLYEYYLSKMFSDRQLFVVKGDVGFKKRQKILADFEATGDGILVCTQQSLKSSANIPTCNEVILESLQWNIPKMEQFYFRFIRLDSQNNTNVHFITYEDSIEQNLMALVLTKERLNEFIKTGEVKEQSRIFAEFDISSSVIESLLRREQDSEGKFYISWGSQRIS